MADNLKQAETELTLVMNQMSAYQQAIGLMNWDLRTGAPKKGVNQRSEALGTLSTEVYKISTSTHLKELLDIILTEEGKRQVSEITYRSAEELKKEYDKNTKIPEEEFKAYQILTTKAESAWEEAKSNADFQEFQPYLEEIVAYKRKFVEYIGYEGHPYNAMLDDFEPGMTVDTLDQVFTELREGLMPLVEGVKQAKQPKTGFLFKHFPKEQQAAFSREVLQSMQYDFEAGRLDETVHPFAIGLHPNDVRVTTKYDESDFRTAVFGTIHEGGHALYEQNISESLVGTVMSDGASMGIHESQSLFFENFVGRSYAFWEHHYDRLKSFADGQFDNVSLDEFYRAVNEAKPSLIRIEADEMTYALHIIVRYEIEKALISGEIEVKDLPGLWNEKMQEYLGVEVPHDGVGVLQDVHWSFGAFGYFPSYALGYIYAAQFKEALDQDIPNFDELLRDGRITPIKEWMSGGIHQHGALKKPGELLQDITGEGTNPQPLLRHLSSKYRSLYNF
ncbi:carboxypeptidase Taq [Salsuginibacillus halophilus]|uniref:Metal-dependent carboxypeptidase n=1 Tax=Salsuginibacillus halophilus TaxID=517424 RepID=A0A2P8HYQ0_9BACI|nr:carboxypeptidase M32 [Salsuginibacillus halophilus]PSL51362.1 carboxypeptidase Taq [Salsuginibacillus halophilus]